MIIETVQSLKKYPNGLKHHSWQNGTTLKASADHTPSLWFSKRFFVAVVVFLCFVNISMITTNTNIAVVEMTAAKIIIRGNQTIVQPAEFHWDPSKVGVVTSIISYGGLFSICGGFFVNKLGGSVSGVFLTFISGILTIIQPAALYIDFRLFFVLRLLTGFFAISFFISAAEIYSRWFPKRERSTLISFCFNGLNVGLAIMYPLYGYIADRKGWQTVFYVSGIISIASAFLCLIFVKNRPSQDKWISEKELIYILNETNDVSQKRVHYHYKRILLSSSVWALFLLEFTFYWMQTIVNGCLPLYVKDLTGRSTDEIGLLSSIPNATTIFLYPLAGTLKDYWKNHTNIELTRMDKIIISVCFLSISILFAACAVFSNFITSMVFFIMIQIVTSSIPSVLETNVVNIAPNDSNIVAGLIKFSTSFSTIICRTVTGFMTMTHTSQEWNNCFVLASGISIAGTAIYVKYGSSEAQSWSLAFSSADEEQDCLIKNNNRK